MVTKHDGNIKGCKAIIVNPVFTNGSNKLLHYVSGAYKMYICNEIKPAMKDKSVETLSQNNPLHSKHVYPLSLCNPNPSPPKSMLYLNSKVFLQLQTTLIQGWGSVTTVYCCHWLCFQQIGWTFDIMHSESDFRRDFLSFLDAQLISELIQVHCRAKKYLP